MENRKAMARLRAALPNAYPYRSGRLPLRRNRDDVEHEGHEATADKRRDDDAENHRDIAMLSHLDTCGLLPTPYRSSYRERE
jgi:hypothetical protein